MAGFCISPWSLALWMQVALKLAAVEMAVAISDLYITFTMMGTWNQTSPAFKLIF